MLEVVADLHCGEGKRSCAELAFCVGKLADYKRRQAGWLRGGFHPAVGRRLTKPAVLLFSVLTARKMCGLAAPSRLGADCRDRLYVG